MKLQNKTAVVTGGASGIGRATTFLLARAGAHVVIGDIDERGGAKASADGKAEGLSVEYRHLNLLEPGSVTEFAGAVLAKADRADILVNAAGWDNIQPFMQNPPEVWEKVIGINLMGPIRLTRALLEPMVAANAGKIVNVASDAGRVGSMGETVYSAAKGGVIAFTKSLAREMARHKINVNCVCPGPTDTPLFAAQPERMRDALARAIPFRRIGKPEEVADAILFFASNQSDYVTGQVLSVSGGLTMVD